MTRVEVIARMAKTGTRPAEIAAQLGLDRKSVDTTLFRLRRSGEHIPSFRTGRPSHVIPQLLPEAASSLSREARRRGMTREALSVQILSVVALDDLFKAVLDTSDCEAA